MLRITGDDEQGSTWHSAWYTIGVQQLHMIITHALEGKCGQFVAPIGLASISVDSIVYEDSYLHSLKK